VRVIAWLACAVLLAVPSARAQAPVLEPAPAGLDAAELAQRARTALIGERSFFEAVLSLRKHEQDRQPEVTFRAWQDRRVGHVFLRVIDPPAEAGTGWLRLPPVVWRYDRRSGEVQSLDDAKLREPFFESAYTLADLLDPPGCLDAAEARLLGIDPKAGGMHADRAYVLELHPPGAKPGERVYAWIEAEGNTPLRCEWRDASDALVATLRFDDVREVEGQLVPMRWTLVTAQYPNRENRIELREIQFAPVFDPAIFSTRQLLQSGRRPAAGTPPSDAKLGDQGGRSP
jgi:hypothetical protein